MADSVIVVGGDQDQDQNTDFAAGVAAATAVTAAETAAEASQDAETAVAVAESAATSAAATAADVAALRAEMAILADDTFEAIAVVAGLAAAAAEETEGEPVDDGAPEVVVNTGSGDVNTDTPATEEATDDKPKPKREKKSRGFGWDAWFGQGR